LYAAARAGSPPFCLNTCPESLNLYAFIVAEVGRIPALLDISSLLVGLSPSRLEAKVILILPAQGPRLAQCLASGRAFYESMQDVGPRVHFLMDKHTEKVNLFDPDYWLSAREGVWLI